MEINWTPGEVPATPSPGVQFISIFNFSKAEYVVEMNTY